MLSTRLAALALALTSALSPLPAQGPVGDPTLQPSGLRVVVVDVDQGGAAILVGPTGIAMLVDGGYEGYGQKRVVPALAKLGVKTVQFLVASHYHPDHVGGLDEVMNAIPVASVWDRGSDGAPSTSSYRDYVKAAGSRRQQVQVGKVFDLGGGARAVVLAENGKVFGGSSYPIVGSYQYENAASVVLRVDYGDFSIWLGGDLTGGGLTTYDMESKVAKVCGNVDVYHVDHHGSNTSSNAMALGYLQPEVCLVSAGYKNQYGLPTTKVTNRINNAGSSRLFLCTTSGANAWQGYTKAGEITLSTDGYRYRVEGAMGRSFDVYTDEVGATAVAAGSLRISELHRLPTSHQGEYLELYCQGPGPVNLRGLQVKGNLGSFTIATPYRMLPGDYLLLGAQGNPAQSGGLPLGHCWPYGSFSLGNSYDSIQLRLNNQVQDSLAYSSSLAGGYAVAAERVSLTATTSPANFRSSTRSYGNDLGTPGARNSVDSTSYGPVAAMEVLPRNAPGGAALHMLASAPAHKLRPHAMALSLSSSPGMTIAGTHIPLNPDVLFDLSLLVPGVRGKIPGSGRRGLRVLVPPMPGLQGLKAYYAHVILDPTGPLPFPAASNAVFFVFP